MKKKDSIRVSKKHGVNPSVIHCFWCDKPIGVALLGKIDRQDSEAPRSIITDYTPCSECREQWGENIPVIEVTPELMYEDLPAIVEGHYPTGRYAVIARNEETETWAQGKPGVFVDQGLFEELFGDEIDAANQRESGSDTSDSPS